MHSEHYEHMAAWSLNRARTWLHTNDKLGAFLAGRNVALAEHDAREAKYPTTKREQFYRLQRRLIQRATRV